MELSKLKIGQSIVTSKLKYSEVISKSLTLLKEENLHELVQALEKVKTVDELSSFYSLLSKHLEEGKIKKPVSGKVKKVFLMLDLFLGG
jgi:hypothetical protein